RLCRERERMPREDRAVKSQSSQPAIGLMCLCLAFVSLAPAGAAPTVDGITPPAGAVGHVITLQGHDLAGASFSVRFGRAQAIDARNPGGSDRVIHLLVPNKVDPRDPDTVPVAVTVDGIEAVTPGGPLQFTYTVPQPLPSITDVATGDPSRPRSVRAGQPFVLTLSGSDFLLARRVPQRCIALGGQVLESHDLASPPSDTSVTFTFPGLGVAGDYEFLVAFSDGS